MDASDRPSPRSRQLQGPRPPRLAVSKDSHKVRKPPVVPQPRGDGVGRQARQQPSQQQQPRAPVIIYDASPKVIHIRPSEFMALVQRLTGPGASSSAPAGAGFDAEPSAPLPPQFQQQPQEFVLSPTAALSPAARYAAIERSVRPLPPSAPSSAQYYGAADGPILLDVDDDAFTASLGPAHRPGILSPVPSALPPAASSGLFSPLDPASLSWLSELSPFLHSAGTATGARDAPPPFAPSPRSLLLSTPTMPSPATFSSMEFFSSNFPDL